MAKSLTIVLLVFAAAISNAFAGRNVSETDDKPFCDCGHLKGCLQNKLYSRQQLRTRCDQQCADKLSHHDAMETCLQARWTTVDGMLQKMLDCVTIGSHNMCSTTKPEEEQEHENRTLEHSEQMRAEYGGEGEEKPKKGAVEDLKPYVNCMKTCMNTNANRPQNNESNSFDWKQLTRDMWAGLRECKKSLSCKLDHDAKTASIANCVQSTGVDSSAFCTVKKDFCKCARGALGKTNAEMPCSSSDEQTTEQPHGAHTTVVPGHH